MFQHTSKRVVLRRLSQDSDGKMLSCEIHLPNIKTPVTSVTSPGLSPGPGPGPCFSPGPGEPAVFTYNVISGSNSSRGSVVSSPSQPLSPPPTMSTPMEFSPFNLTPTPSPRPPHDNPGAVETKFLEPSRDRGQDVSMVLKPVSAGHSVSVSPRRPSPAESTTTLINEPYSDINISHERLDKRGSPRPYPLNRIRDTNFAMSSLR